MKYSNRPCLTTRKPKPMKKTGLFVLLILFMIKANYAPAQEQIIDEVVAVVGGNFVLQSDIEAQYMQYRMQGVIKDTRSIRCQILEDMLFQKLARYYLLAIETNISVKRRKSSKTI